MAADQRACYLIEILLTIPAMPPHTSYTMVRLRSDENWDRYQPPTDGAASATRPHMTISAPERSASATPAPPIDGGRHSARVGYLNIVIAAYLVRHYVNIVLKFKYSVKPLYI